MAAGLLTTATAASAAPRTADIRLVYQAPQISSDGKSVTWRWTVSNVGADPADEVKVTHQVIPATPIATVSSPCTQAAGKVACDYGTILPGAVDSGEITTGEPDHNLATMRISGTVTWQERTLTAVTDSDRPMTR